MSPSWSAPQHLHDKQFTKQKQWCEMEDKHVHVTAKVRFKRFARLSILEASALRVQTILGSTVIKLLMLVAYLLTAYPSPPSCKKRNEYINESHSKCLNASTLSTGDIFSTGHIIGHRSSFLSPSDFSREKCRVICKRL